jgi:acetyl esterase/lipase
MEVNAFGSASIQACPLIEARRGGVHGKLAVSADFAKGFRTCLRNCGQMEVLRMREVIGFGVLASALLLGSAALSQDRDMRRACSKDVLQLCNAARGDRSAMRQCMMENRDKLSATCRAALRDRRGDSAAAPAPTMTFSYGNHELQAIDYYKASTSTAAPLVVFIHGGGWSIGDKRSGAGAKPVHFTTNGYAFASINYRLVPDATVEQQAADVANALDALRFRASSLGFDPDRIVLMGHSAGAHLAALVAADPAYLRAAEVPIEAVRAVVLLDGAGYDVSLQMANDRASIARFYVPAFGRDPKRQAQLSPAKHAAAPNVRNWLALYVSSREASAAQARLLVGELTSAGAKARAVAIDDTSHMQLNQALGAPGDAATATVDAFLRSVI